MINGLVYLVQNTANITALIGTSPVRFFPLKLPQGLTSYPAIAYRYMTQPNNSFDGASPLDDYMVDIFCYAESMKGARDLFETFRTEIEDQTGTYDSVVITQIRYQTGGDEDYLEDMNLYTKRGEFEISVRR